MGGPRETKPVSATQAIRRDPRLDDPIYHEIVRGKLDAAEADWRAAQAMEMAANRFADVASEQQAKDIVAGRPATERELVKPKRQRRGRHVAPRAGKMEPPSHRPARPSTRGH